MIKRKLFQRYQDRYSMELSHPKISQLDLAYHDIKRGRGVFDLLQRKGLAARVTTDEEIDAAVNTPPQTTRAKLRGSSSAPPRRPGGTSPSTGSTSSSTIRPSAPCCAGPVPVQRRAGEAAHREHVTSAASDWHPLRPHVRRAVLPLRLASVAPTKISKVERMMNLVIALLSTSGYLTAERIRANVIGYGQCPTDEAFSRMFERIGELRDLGIPLETGRASAFEPTEGYRIKRGAYALPDIDLTPWTRRPPSAWRPSSGSPRNGSGSRRTRCSNCGPPGGRRPRRRGDDKNRCGAGRPAGSDAVLGTLLSAIDARRAVRFKHRPSPVGAYLERNVEPWGVVTARGRWYLVGHDRDRDDTRIFRLSRIIDVQADGPSGEVRRPDGVGHQGARRTRDR